MYSRTFLRTRCVFKGLRDIWYPIRKKTVPDDLQVDKELLVHWIIGDGTVSFIQRRWYGFSLATQGFDDISIQRCQRVLSEAGITSNRRRDGDLHINRTSANKDVIAKLAQHEFPDCYRYKCQRLIAWAA